MRIFLLFIFVCSAAASDRSDENVDDIKLDLSTIFNDPNIVKTKSDSSGFVVEKQTKNKLKYGKHYQGDIVLTAQQTDYLDDLKNRKSLPPPPPGVRHSALISPFYRWPKDKKGKVIVPYKISNDYTPEEKYIISTGMDGIELYTCIKFVPRTRQEDYVYIKSNEGCSSQLGKVGGRQIISLESPGCIDYATVIHELVHALGFDHIQSRSDRDDHIKILWKNIEEDEKDQFAKVDSTEFTNLDTPYDYYSIMHYDPTAFSKNGKRTIIPKVKSARNLIGQVPRLSIGDVQRIKRMYDC